jgi:hypothetical protein
LQFAHVKPIFKHGSKYESANYRPVSLLSTFSKVLENVIYNRMHEQIERDRILDDNQYGFCLNTTAEKASFKFVKEIIKAINNKLGIVTIEGW